MLCSLQGNAQMISLDLFGKHSKILKNRMEQHFQDVAQKLQYDKDSETFVAHFAQHFDQKPIPQQCRNVLKFEILSTVNPIRSMSSSCTLCMKERLKIISHSQHRYKKLINSCSWVFGSSHHNLRFHRFTRY